MSYQVPTLDELLDRARKAFRKYLRGSDAWLWPNNVVPTVKVIAGGLFEIFGFAGYIAKMIFVHTAPDIETLRKHGTEYGMPQLPARAGEGKATITSDGDIAVDVAAVFQRGDGAQYLASAAVSRTGAGTLVVPVVAAANGASGNAEAGTPLSIVSGVTDTAGTATAEVSTAVTGGADVEDKERYRARLLFRKRNPPHGGAPSDYVLWASSVVGVSRVFVERRWAGAGTIRVFVLMDDLYANGIPPMDAVARVADYIETVCPAGALVSVVAPTAAPIDIQIAGLTPNTIAVQEAVLASLREGFRRLGRVAGNDVERPSMPYLAYPTSFSRSWIWQAVANATGEERHIVNLPTADRPLFPGQIPTLGNVTFV